MSGTVHRGREGATLALAALAVSLPLSPAGSAPQWDELVLAGFACWAAWRISRVTRSTTTGRRPWQVLATSALLFAIAALLTGTGLGGDFGGLGAGDALLAVASLGPTLTCALLALRNAGARWPVLVLDGVMVTVALVTVVDVLVLSPALAPGALAPGLLPVAIGYSLYPAVTVGLAGALCTVSTTAMRRSATAMLVTTTLLGLSSALLAVHIARPGEQLWSAATDIAVLLSLVAAVRAAERAPRTAETSPAAIRAMVNPVGLGIQVTALFGAPATLGAALVLDLPIPDIALGCIAVLLVLLPVRMLDRIRVSGRIQDDLLRSEADFRGLVEASSDGVAIVDVDLRLEFTSPAARTLLGVRTSDPHPVLLDLLHEEDRPRARVELTGPVGGITPALQLRVPGADGDPRDLEVTHHERPGSGRRVLHLRDVTTRRRRERELERMAFTDHLTRLPNRAMLFQEMTALSAVAGERCLLVLDLDGFKAVNDTAGHEAGDLLLVEVARRLQNLLRADDLVARLGGDEFAVLMAGDEDAAVEAAQRVVEVLAHPYRMGGGTFLVGASVGLSRVHPGSGQLAFRQADTALRAAKQAGKGCWRVHTEDRVAAAAATSDVAAALADGEVQLRYDVIAHGDTGILAAVHASPVWVHGELGVLPAAELWAAAERQGQTSALQQWLFTRCCTEVAAVDDALPVAVDLPAGLVHADDLPGEVAAALATAGMAPRRLTLRFTEEVLQAASAALIPALHSVHEAGVALGLDDYGMGSTLWSHLARVPLDVVMVDIRSLSARGNSDRTLDLLAAIAHSCRSFDLDTVATGIGTDELLRQLRHQGLVAVSGPALPSGLTATQVASLLRHPSSAVVAPMPATPRPHAQV